VTTSAAPLQTLLASASAAWPTQMSHNLKPPFPASRAFVVKFRDDCDPAAGRWQGRVENVASAKQFEFDSAEQLLLRLAAMTPQQPGDASSAGTADNCPSTPEGDDHV
jgi:hypothetical protein